VPRKEKPNVKLRFAHSKRRFNRRQRNALNKKRRG
jgi:hypothetical protein